MNPLIEQYITKNYYTLLDIAKKITKNHDLSKDLLHEIIIQLYDKKEIKLKSYDNNSIKYWIVAIMRTNWYSTTSPFYYKIRREMTKYTNIDEIFNLADESQLDFEKQIIFDILEESWAELDWFRKSIFTMYMGLGSMKKVSKQTRIPLSSISRYLKESREQIKQEITIKINE